MFTNIKLFRCKPMVAVANLFRIFDIEGKDAVSDLFYTFGQALAGSRISIPGFFGTGFYQIPGSRDFSGRDFLIFLIPGFYWNLSGFFGIFIFALFACQIGSFSSIFIITISLIITTTIVIHHHHSLRSSLATQSLPSNRCQKSYSYHANYSSNVLKGLLSWMWRSMYSLNVLSKNMHLSRQSQLKCMFKVSLLNVLWWYFQMIT